MTKSGRLGHGHPSMLVRAEKKIVLEIRANGWELSDILGEGLEHRKTMSSKTREWEQPFSLRSEK